MDKKACSRPMKAIIDRMLAFGEFEIFTFGDSTILNKPVSEWPHCECLLSWHSDGFPLAKAIHPPVPSSVSIRILFKCSSGTSKETSHVRHLVS